MNRQTLNAETGYGRVLPSSMALIQKVAGEDSLELAPCQTFAWQTLARLLNRSCRYERPKLFQPGRNPLLFAC
jgi:hypothetical protein